MPADRPMKDWIGYVRSLRDKDVWGLVLLDYFHSIKPPEPPGPFLERFSKRSLGRRWRLRSFSQGGAWCRSPAPWCGFSRGRPVHHCPDSKEEDHSNREATRRHRVPLRSIRCQGVLSCAARRAALCVVRAFPNCAAYGSAERPAITGATWSRRTFQGRIYQRDTSGRGDQGSYPSSYG